MKLTVKHYSVHVRVLYGWKDVCLFTENQKMIRYKLHKAFVCGVHKGLYPQWKVLRWQEGDWYSFYRRRVT